jgi:hypothetical protein
MRTLSLNGRLHWAEQRRLARVIRDAAFVVALNRKLPRLEHVAIKVTYHPPDRRRRDNDNIPAASGKHAIDGIVLAGVLEDDCPPHVTGISYEVGDVVKGGQLVLTITETPPRGAP